MTTRAPNYGATGYVGQGVNVDTVKRAYSNFLSGQVLTEQSQASMLNTYHAQIQQIDNVIADPAAGVSPAIQDLFTSISNVSSSPESQAARQAMLNNASALSSRFQSLGQRFSDVGVSVNTQIANSVSLINGYSTQISALNKNISMLQASNAQPPNDLLDQRDQLVGELNKEIKTTVVRQNDGAYNIFIGNGQSLVLGSTTFSLAMKLSSADPSKQEIVYNNIDGSKTSLQQSSLQGGNLGGLMTFRDTTLTASQNALGRVAMGLAGMLNQQHQLGQDLNGDLGGNLFVQPQPAVFSNSLNHGEGVVTASIATPSDYANLTGNDYSLRFDGGTKYTLTSLSDNKQTVFPNGLPATPVEGLTLTTTAGAMPGDTYLIRPTANGASDIRVAITDPSKIAAATPIRSNASISNQGSGKITAITVNSPSSVLTPDPEHPLTDLNLRNPVTIKFTSPTTFDVMDGKSGLPLAAGRSYVPGQEISVNGWSTKISCNPASGDTFTVGDNINATADSSNALLMANLQTQNTLGAPAGGTPTMTFQGAYAQWVSDVGNKSRELEVTSTAQTAMAEQTVAAQQAMSGVNLDEEAANLMRYQRAYQAAGKAMQIANSMFDTILELGR
jgi:flagellar hook-associated protein 1 FlgK